MARMLDNKKLQAIRDAILGVTGGKFGDLNSTIYLQQIRDAIRSVSPAETRGNLAEHIYLQQIRNALLGVPDGKFGNLPNSVYLQQIINASNGVPDGKFGSLSENTYLNNIIGDVSYIQNIKLQFGSSIVAYWPLNEGSGAICNDVSGHGYNGTYSNIALSNTVGPKGARAPYFDGVNSHSVNIFSAGLAGAVDGVRGTLALWIKAYSAALWTDAVTRNIFSLASANSVDAFLGLYKFSGTNNKVLYSYRANNIWAGRDPTTTSTEWIFCAITWDKPLNQCKTFINGVQYGATEAILGVWFGPLVKGYIGSDTNVNTWKGWMSNVLLLNRAATPAEILSIYTNP
jgi:hypothetical protein